MEGLAAVEGRLFWVAVVELGRAMLAPAALG